MCGVDSVVHLAALLHINNPPSELKDRYVKINVGGTINIVNAAVQENVRRILYFGTIAVYGDSMKRVLNEESLPAPRTFYDKTKLDAERIVLSAENHLGQRTGTVFRLGAVYGSRIKGNYRQLLKALAKHRFIPIGDGHNRRTLVYDKDVASACVLALAHPAAGGKIFNVSDGEFHTIHNIISAMCSALGRKTPTFSLPYRPVRFVAGLLEDLFQAVKRRAPITRAAVDKFTEDTAVDSGRIRTELGFRSKYKLEEGWKETVQEMRREGEL